MTRTAAAGAAVDHGVWGADTTPGPPGVLVRPRPGAAGKQLLRLPVVPGCGPVPALGGTPAKGLSSVLHLSAILTPAPHVIRSDYSAGAWSWRTL